MGHVSLFALLVTVGLAAGTTPAAAQQVTATETLNASFAGIARLTFSSSSVSFPDADPDAVPSVPATQGPITITAKARTTRNGTIALTVRASGALRSGVNTIPAGNVTWTCTGSGFSNGTLSSTAAQVVATWTGSGVRTGTQTFFFKNLWSYPTGIYTLTMNYTLTAA
jgi:hypothetical protein